MLDWARAHDRLEPDSMNDALRRLGMPADMVSTADAVCAAQFSTIVDRAGRSTERRQHAGIAR
eukprot:7442845-Pyramimonas_sp.AAC.1